MSHAPASTDETWIGQLLKYGQSVLIDKIKQPVLPSQRYEATRAHLCQPNRPHLTLELTPRHNLSHLESLSDIHLEPHPLHPALPLLSAHLTQSFLCRCHPIYAQPFEHQPLREAFLVLPPYHIEYFVAIDPRRLKLGSIEPLGVQGSLTCSHSWVLLVIDRFDLARDRG